MVVTLSRFKCEFGHRVYEFRPNVDQGWHQLLCPICDEPEVQKLAVRDESGRVVAPVQVQPVPQQPHSPSSSLISTKLLEAMLQLFRYSWNDIQFRYDSLTDREQSAITYEEFLDVCTLMQAHLGLRSK